MKSLILLAIVGVVGVSLIAGIVAYQFIRGQIQEQQDRQRGIDLEKKAILQDEYDTKFSAYVNESIEKCGLGETINTTQTEAKKCYDSIYKKQGLADPKFNVFKETE